MTQNFKWTINLQVDGGPSFTVPGNLTLDDYDSISVSLKAGASQTVAVPGSKDKVQLVFIGCDLLGAPGAVPPVTVAVGGGAAQPIDQTLLLAGAVAVNLLSNPPGNLIFKNNDGAKTANVQILVGRNEG